MSKLCKKMIDISKETWERIEFARNRQGLKIYETTITQNILFDLNKSFTSAEIKIFEAIDERTNGNDIELFIKTNVGYLFFPIQAKIIYANSKYEALEHGNKINDLIGYATKKNGYPLYLLYNYDRTFTYNKIICGQTANNKVFGCSIISADYLLNNYAFNRIDRNGNSKWTIPSFFDLHPVNANPLFVLSCCSSDNDNYISFLTKIIPNFSEEELNSLKVYSEEEVLKDKSWATLSMDKMLPEEKQKENQDVKVFAPKFRIVFE